MGGKLTRHESNNSQSLSKQTIKELCQDTGFTEEELLIWHKNFYKDCPGGKLTLKHFEHEYSKMMGKSTSKTSEYIKHMFNIYDEDKNQFIDFREFVMALSVACAVNRLRLIETLFSIFDLDCDGKITKDEIGKMLHSLDDVTNLNNKSQHYSNKHNQNKNSNLQKRIDEAFNELNINQDDHITKDEFIEWYIKSGFLNDPTSNEIKAPDLSCIQRLDKKARQMRRRQPNKPNQEENIHHPQIQCYISRMTERKSVPNINDLDEEFDDKDASIQNERTSSIGSELNSTTENERWQHIFNLVLGQLRTKRSQNPNERNQVDSMDSNQCRTWKQQTAEEVKLQYYRQKSNDHPVSLDIVTIRL